MAIIQTIPLGKKYGSMTSSEAQAGTNTESQLISAKVLNDQIDEKISDIGLATVATSGSYNDLNDKPAIPTIPTVNNGTLTIQKNGTTVKTFSANASANVTANITVPTKTSQLSNDSDYATSADVADSLQEAKNYVGITTSNFVTTDTTQTIIGTKTFSKTIVGDLVGNATTSTSATKATQDASGNVITSTYQTKLSTAQLAAVNSGVTSTKVTTYDAYAAAIGTKANSSDLTSHTTNNNIHVTSSDKSNWNNKSNFSGSYTDLTNKPTLPTKVSDLTNDSGFINNTDNCVHLTGNESVTGIKYFTKDIYNKNENTVVAETPSTNQYIRYLFVDNNNKHLASIQYANRTKGIRDLSFYLSTADGTTLGVIFDTNKSFYPLSDNYSLGTSDRKWANVYATNFTGDLVGNATTATSSTKATQDASGNVITTTYATKTEVSTKANNSAVVHLTGNETINGTKTFSDVKFNISAANIAAIIV